jgi:hypothetical protein
MRSQKNLKRPPLRASLLKRGRILDCRISDWGTQISFNDHKSFSCLEALVTVIVAVLFLQEQDHLRLRDCDGGKKRETCGAWSGDWIIRPGGCQFVAEKGEKREKARLFS